MSNFSWKSLRALDQLFWLCLPVAAFFVIVAFMMSIELPRLHELALEMEPVVGKLLSKEVRFVPRQPINADDALQRVDGSDQAVPLKGYWCAFGLFELVAPEVAKTMQLEGQLSRIRRTSKRGHSIYTKLEAGADLPKFEVGDGVFGLDFFGGPRVVPQNSPV